LGRSRGRGQDDGNGDSFTTKRNGGPKENKVKGTGLAGRKKTGGETKNTSEKKKGKKARGFRSEKKYTDSPRRGKVVLGGPSIKEYILEKKKQYPTLEKAGEGCRGWGGLVQGEAEVYFKKEGTKSS